MHQMYHKLGHQLLDKGIWFCRNAFKLNPQPWSRATVRDFLSHQLSLSLNNISVADELVYVEEWNKWIPIIEYDLIDQQIYQADHRDCDNYAFLYASRASMIYGLNSCAVAFGNIYDIKTGELICRHAFNLIISREGEMLKLKGYEPQTDESFDWVIGTGGKSQKLGWRYTADWVILF